MAGSPGHPWVLAVAWAGLPLLRIPQLRLGGGESPNMSGHPCARPRRPPAHLPCKDPALAQQLGGDLGGVQMHCRDPRDLPPQHPGLLPLPGGP